MVLCFQECLIKAFERTDLQLGEQYLQGCAEAGSSGAAVVCAVVIDQTLILANAGDCRAVLSTEGTTEMLTCDHKANDDKEKERIENLGGSVDDSGYLCGRLQLARALGDFDPAIKIIGRGLVINVSSEKTASDNNNKEERKKKREHPGN